MAIPTFLEQLLTAAGPSGHETGPAEVWRKACQSFADEVGGDNVGSSFARVNGKASGAARARVGPNHQKGGDD
jgi:putative aminopeptidase FrvX